MEIMQNINISVMVRNCYDPYFKHPTTEWQIIQVVGVLGVKAWMSNYRYILCSFVKMISNSRTGLSNSKHTEAGSKIPHFCRRMYFYWRPLHLDSIYSNLSWEWISTTCDASVPSYYIKCNYKFMFPGNCSVHKGLLLWECNICVECITFDVLPLNLVKCAYGTFASRKVWYTCYEESVVTLKSMWYSSTSMLRWSAETLTLCTILP